MTRFLTPKDPDPVKLVRTVDHLGHEVQVMVQLNMKRSLPNTRIDGSSDTVYLAAVTLLVDRDLLLPVQYVTPTLVMYTVATMENEGKRYIERGCTNNDDIIESLKAMKFVKQ